MSFILRCGLFKSAEFLFIEGMIVILFFSVDSRFPYLQVIQVTNLITSYLLLYEYTRSQVFSYWYQLTLQFSRTVTLSPCGLAVPSLRVTSRVPL